MDDNARPHRTLAVEELLESEDVTRMDWPAYSPDLNPFEHVWDALSRRIAARLHLPEDTQQLKQMLIEEWALLPQEMLHQLVLRMQRRCEATIAETSHLCSKAVDSDVVAFREKHLIGCTITLNSYKTLASVFHSVFKGPYEPLWQPHPLLHQGVPLSLSMVVGIGLQSASEHPRTSHTYTMRLRSGDTHTHRTPVQSLNILRLEAFSHQLSYVWACVVAHKYIWSICSTKMSEIWCKDLVPVPPTC
ncbi:transposable element Tcb2 transposase [Trichonephila clavipes]|nr:transposable element Tcb2 transposase [Trichonephila clavipes]